MTAIASLPSDGTRILRTAGILMLVAGVGAAGNVAIGQVAMSSASTSDSFAGPWLGLALLAGLVGLVAGLAYIAAFVVIWAWNAGFGRQLVLFAPVFGALLGIGSWISSDQVLLLVGRGILVLLVVLAALYVWQQRIFLPLGSVIFLVTTVVAQAPAVGGTVDPSSATLEDGLSYLAAGCFVLCGLAMIRGARERSKLIRSGVIER